MASVRNGVAAQASFPRENAAKTPYPPAFLEYFWYASLAYAMLGKAWGIVIPSVGGIILVLIAAACFLSIGGQAAHLYKPVAWALGSGILLIVIQLLFHKTTEAALSEGIAFVGWLAMLIIAQSFSVRQGFLQRFALAALAIGVASLPYIQMQDTGGIVRARASGTGISNANSLGMWFGFCTVYFCFWGLHFRKPLLRAVSWAVAIGCLYVVTLTVSRGPLLGIVLACVVGFRSTLKGSFFPLLSLVLLMCLVYISGIFDEEIGYYTARGAEESGREKLWPMALERILDSPWVGVGLDEIRIQLTRGRFINPHNGLLHIVLGAGIVPLICFLVYLAQVGIGSIRIMQRAYVGEPALFPPLVTFAMFETMMLDMAFMSPWTVVVFGLAASASQAVGNPKSMSP